MSSKENSEQDYENRPRSEISLSLKDHNIGFVLPFGAQMNGLLLLPCGALIYGDYVGDIFCESGSIIIHKGGSFRGMAEAENIYIEGDVASLPDNKRRSILIGRKMIAGSANSKINADLFSTAFEIRKAKVWGSLRSLDESASLRKNNRAVKKT